MRFPVTYFFLVLTVLSGGVQAQQVLPTGQMVSKPVIQPAVVRLQDGRVLLIGGSYNSSAQIYDPASGEWRLTGSTVASKPYASAVLLNDGRVLVAGSQIPEIFSPETETFHQIESTPAAALEATLLADGRVLLKNPGGVVSLFDPLSETTVDAGTIPDGIPIALPDGRLAMVGASSVSLFEVQESALHLLVRHDYSGHLSIRSAVGLNDGTIFLTGRIVSDPDLGIGNVMIYDPKTGGAQLSGRLPMGQRLFGADLLSNGTLLTEGAYFSEDPGADEQWAPPGLYDPSTGQFTNVQGIDPNYKATSLLDGRVLITHKGPYSGGFDGRGPTAALYVPEPRVVSAASLWGRVSPGSLATLYGVQLTAEPISADLSGQLPTNLGGVSLAVISEEGEFSTAKLLYAGPDQVNFVVPSHLLPGEATAVVHTPGGDAITHFELDRSAPALFSFSNQSAAAYGLKVEPDGAVSIIPPQVPIELDERPTYLVLYGTGIRNFTSLDNVHCTIGGVEVPVAYAGPDGAGVPGLDQVNVLLPQDLQGSGVVYLSLTVDGIQSNTVTIHLR